jgi:Family of unknown function (DUF6318)
MTDLRHVEHRSRRQLRRRPVRLVMLARGSGWSARAASSARVAWLARFIFVCAAVVLCAVAAACDNGTKPPAAASAPPTTTGSPPGQSATPSQPGQSATPSATPSRTGPLLTGAGVSPGEVPPTLPAAAQQDSQVGALNFGGYFVRALDWSLATTDPYLIKQFSAPSCETCASYIDGLSKLAASGGHLTGGRATLRSVGIVQGKLVKADYVVQVSYDQQPEVIYEAGAVPSTPPAPPNPGDQSSVHHLGSWSLATQRNRTSRMNRATTLLVAGIVLSCLTAYSAWRPTEANAGRCGGSASGGTASGGFFGRVRGNCDGGTDAGAPTEQTDRNGQTGSATRSAPNRQTGSATRTVDCGPVPALSPIADCSLPFLVCSTSPLIVPVGAPPDSNVLTLVQHSATVRGFRPSFNVYRHSLS